MLLLAFFGALVLLLSSLSIQTAALQARSSEFSLRRRRQQEDALASAAQLVASRLAAFPCALGLSLRAWIADDTCMSKEVLQRLSTGTMPGPDAERGTYLLTDYSPQSNGSGVIDGALLTVRWTPTRGRVSQRRFRVLLAATGSDGSLRLQGVRP